MKMMPWKFRILNTKNSQIIYHEVCIFLKKYVTFWYIVLFLFVCKQAFHMSWVRISQKINGVIMKNLRHIFMKISLDFYIYISVLLAVTVTATSSFLCLDCVKSVQFLVRIFLYSDWIRRFTEYRIQENRDQK